MGCFNVSCGISGISMYTDNAVLIPLLPSDSDYLPNAITGANIVSNSGTKVFYYPMTLPIFGNVDSYGRLENIQKDTNTKCIEKFFEMKINEFVEAVCAGERFEMPDGWKKFNNEYLKNVAGMFVHREIWDFLTRESLDEFGEPDSSIYDSGDLIDEVLALIGFRFEKEDKGFDPRYNRLMTRKDMPEVKIYSDGRWVETVIKGKKHHGTYNLKALIELIEKESGYTFAPAQIRRIKATSHWEPQITASLAKKAESDKEVASHKKSLAAAKKNKDSSRIELYQRLIDMGGLAEGLLNNPFNMFTLGGMYDDAAKKLFSSLYGKSLNAIVPLLMKHQQVEKAMFSVNRLYMPTFNGYQHGNHHMSKMLYQKSLDIVTAKIKEESDDEDED